jgi:hypothetical protein
METALAPHAPKQPVATTSAATGAATGAVASDLIPPLLKGYHPHPAENGGGCVMEYASLLAGEEWSDAPACTHPLLASAARSINDDLTDTERQRLAAFLPALMGTTPPITRSERRSLSWSLALWSARHVQPHLTSQHQGFFDETLTIALAHKSTQEGHVPDTVLQTAALDSARNTFLDAMSRAGDIAPQSIDEPAMYAVAQLAKSAYLSVAARPVEFQAEADSGVVYNAVSVVGRISPQATLDYLGGLISEYDRLTGRTPDQYKVLTEADYALLAAALTSPHPEGEGSPESPAAL